MFINPFLRTSYSCSLFMPSNHHGTFALLLFANVIRLRQSYSSLLAPLAQSELLISLQCSCDLCGNTAPRACITNHRSFKKHSAGQCKYIRKLETIHVAIHSYRSGFSQTSFHFLVQISNNCSRLHFKGLYSN